MATKRMERRKTRRNLTIIMILACLGIAIFFLMHVLAASSHNEEAITELVVVGAPLKYQFPPKNRTVLLVHIGKAGGLTLKEQLKEWKQYFDNNRITVFPKSFHMWSQLELLEEATTYLVTLRNPVDRIISTYRYSHVENCTPEMQRLKRKPFGCSVKRQSRSNPKMRQWAEKVFGHCFPSAAMEEFAQSVMSPWPTLPQNGSMPLSQQRNCQLLARQMVEGSLVEPLVVPHMEFNYEYYASKSIRQYPNKEVWVVRLEQMEQDLNHLQRGLGGGIAIDTNLPPSKVVSHGSEGYMPSPLSAQAYQKLCCVLHKELKVYEEFLSMATNLLHGDRQESMQELRTKCGLDTHKNWEDWRNACKAHLTQDWEILEKPQMKAETVILHLPAALLFFFLLRSCSRKR